MYAGGGYRLGNYDRSGREPSSVVGKQSAGNTSLKFLYDTADESLEDEESDDSEDESDESDEEFDNDSTCSDDEIRPGSPVIENESSENDDSDSEQSEIDSDLERILMG